MVVANWMRNHNTIEYLGIWEQLNNPDFKPIEFEGFLQEAGSNAFTLSPKKWAESTNAIGLFVKVGRGGGTFAHKNGKTAKLVSENGKLEYDGKTDSMHEIAGIMMNSPRRQNGFEYFFVNRNNHLISIDDVRNEYRKTKENKSYN